VSIVVDSSVTLAWVIHDEKSALTERILEMVLDGGAWVPTIWRLEVLNGLQQAVKRRRLDQKSRDDAIIDLSNLNIVVDPDTNTFAWSHTVELADRFGLTSYDASYLELASRRALPLATLDRALRAAGKKLGISLL
jgi:predicted nucleic acid-binding protein